MNKVGTCCPDFMMAQPCNGECGLVHIFAPVGYELKKKATVTVCCPDFMMARPCDGNCGLVHVFAPKTHKLKAKVTKQKINPIPVPTPPIKPVVEKKTEIPKQQEQPKKDQSAAIEQTFLIPGYGICKYFNTVGGCRDGKYCSFKHEKSEIPPVRYTTNISSGSNISSNPNKSTRSNQSNLPKQEGNSSSFFDFS